MAAGRITLETIETWERRMGAKLSAWELSTIIDLDAFVMRLISEERKRKAEQQQQLGEQRARRDAK